MKYCIIIPHYKHHVLFEKFLPALASLNLPCIVVDDGSGEESVAKVAELLAPYADFHLVKHQTNRGKGASVITGCYHASAMGFSHVLQLDADGQHDINDAQKLLEYSRSHPETFISGKPYFDETAPLARKYGRRISDFWMAIETLSLKIKDGLCGFRVYPIKQIEHVFDNYYLGPRMDFDPEILVRLYWQGATILSLPTKVIYPPDGHSNFRVWEDNYLISCMHTRLVFGMIWRAPNLIWRKFR